MTQCLSRFWKRSAQPSPTNTHVAATSRVAAGLTAADLPDELAAHETVARFIFRDRDMFKGDKAGWPKPSAFKPELWEARWELSVCRNTGLESTRIWEIGRTCRKDKVALARADVSMTAVQGTNLTGLAAPTEYPEHAVLLGWPDDTQKDAQLAHQQDLARAAVGHLAPEEPTVA